MLALACRPPEAAPTTTTSPPPTATPTAGTGTLPGPTGDTGPPAPDAPWIDVALADRCPDPTPDGVWSQPGDDLHLVTLADATARCNDGTPPVMWVRAASDPAHAGDWVVHLDGGNYCADPEGCAVRWCGEDFFDASKMSSRWAPGSRLGEGILAQTPENTFAGYNHAFLHYCSSDLWLGTRAGHVWDGDPPFRVDVSGHDILAAQVDALIAGATSDDGAEVLPRLADADLLLFGGSSAGGYGAAMNLDFVAAQLPGVRVLGLPDAIFARPFDLMDPAQAAVMTAEVERLYTEVGEPVWGAWLDESCVAANAAEPWRCIDLDPMFRDGHLDVPWLLHHDIYDDVLFENYRDVMTRLGFASLSIDGLRAFSDASPQASVHGTACGEHTVLDGTASFLQMSVVDAEAGGEPVTLHDAVVAFVAGERVQVVDALTTAGSVCGP